MATLTTLASFSATTGMYPDGTLLEDGNGNLFGTTRGGGANADGTVFEIADTASGYAATSTTLASFNGANGSAPEAGLIEDTNGDFFGTTEGGGGTGNAGTVFEVANTAGSYTINSLVTFGSINGGVNPFAGLITDAAGDLFGTTAYGGGAASNSGTVFEIAKTAGGYASTATLLTSFQSSTGGRPLGGLIADANGDLFGTASNGGASADGGVFEIAKTANGYAAPTFLATFNGTNGSLPYGSLSTDANGDLFGTTSGGGANFYGTVFEIAKTAGGYASTVTTIASFTQAGPNMPNAGVIVDAKGDLFGTTTANGNSFAGAVYEVAKTAGVYASTPTTLVAFNTTNGYDPATALIADSSGDLFGTTLSGGAANDGTVFELTNAGYSVACYCHGTRILTPGGEVPVEALAIGDLVVTAAGASEPVRWIGRRSYAGRFLAGRTHLLPILFRAGSLGDGLPRRDLLVSPAHAMFLDGVLVPAASLVNGTSIVQDHACDRVDYVHVELAHHDAILAEGAASETFLDDDSRAMFHNYREFAALYPDAPAPANFFAPRVEDGYVLEAIRQRLATVAVGKAIAA